ncbi:MAG: hypothetical protein ACM3O7_09380 [Acidobacteriota bacterium]
MTAPGALRTAWVLLVVLYLCAAGWFFILAPWSRFWAQQVVPGAPFWLLAIVDSPVLRGALSGFGALHFPVAATYLTAGAART